MKKIYLLLLFLVYFLGVNAQTEKNKNERSGEWKIACGVSIFVESDLDSSNIDTPNPLKSANTLNQLKSSILSPGAILIDFDDVTAPCFFVETTPISTEYSSKGVTFSGSGFSILNECGTFDVTGYSSPNHVAWNSSISSMTETLTFSPLVNNVSFLAGSYSGSTLTANAYDQLGTLLGTQVVSLESIMQSVNLLYTGIAKVEISIVGEPGIMDDLTFEYSTCHEDITVDNEPGKCGAVVTYTTPAVPEGWNLTQTDVSGYTSGDEFPIGTTSLEYQIDSAGMNISTCSFTVTVNDTEAPVINCPENIVVSSDSAECGAIVTFSTLAEEVLLDEVLPGSLSGWEVYDYPNNPTFYYEEITSPYDGTTAINTRAVGNTVMYCSTESITKIYNISGNSGTTDLQAYLEFAFNSTYYNFPYITVELQDIDGASLGYEYYYGKGIFGGYYSGVIAGYPDYFTELPSASGDMILDLSKIGENIDFDKISIKLSNYTCIGENSIVFDHLRVINGSPDNGGPVASDNCSGVLVEASIPSGSLFPIGATTVALTATDAAGNVTSCSFTVTVVDSIAPVAECKETGDLGKAAYIISTAGKPWGQSTNEQAMDMVFGAGNWEQLYYENLDADALLSKNYDFIFMEGGDDIADEMEEFVNANISEMETWVANGGNLFLNAAPNEGDGMNWGFWGITLQYNDGPYSDMVKAIDINHPIFTGPFTPVTDEYTGTSFAHAIIPEELNVKFLINEYNNPDYHVLSELEWGKGKVFVGGMTTTNFHSPQPDALNLRANMLNYLGTKSSLEFELDKNGQVTITPDNIDGGSTDNCGIASIDIDKTQFTTADLGEQIITLTVTDNAGNSSTCQSTIMIVEPEVIKPKAVCNPININLDADGTYKLDSLDMVEITGLAPDSLMTFDDLKIFAYPDTFTTANIEWPVFVRITEYDENYNKTRCWAMVTVHDSMPPIVVGNDIEVMLDSTGLAVITKEQVTDSATFDVSGIVSTSIDKDTFTCENIGENWVMLSATDIYGNVGTDSVLVTVSVELPNLDSIQDISITLAAGVCETAIEYPIPVLTQICGISATQTAGLGRDAMFPVGTTAESWTIIDYKGDTTLVSFDVIVTSPNDFPALDEITDITVDEDAPEISIPVTGITYGNDCQVQTVTVVAESDNTALVDSIAVVYTDGDTIGLVKLILAPDVSGTAKITVTVTDSEGASMFRHFNLMVNEVADTITNKDGNLATAVWTKEIETGINMYPNPTQDVVTIDIRNYSASQTEVAVFSITGSEVLRKTYPVGETIRFSMNEQVSGVYLVKMNIDGNHIIKKLVVDKK